MVTSTKSTIQALDGALRTAVPVGGFVIVDDYGVFPNCKAAVTDFRNERGIRASFTTSTGSGVYWQRDVH